MQQVFERGSELKDNSRIRKMICFGEDWQIYLTNRDSYVLAVSKELLNRWNSLSAFPDGFFESAPDDSSCLYLSSSSGFLISSLEDGPYPVNVKQVLRFSASFGKAVKLFGVQLMQNAIYLEEYEMLLPVKSTRENTVDSGTVYATWLTAGVSISIEQSDRIAALTSWIPSEAMAESKALAGFDIVSNDQESGISKQANKTNVLQEKENTDGSVPNEPFVLLGRPELEKFFNDNIVEIVRHQEKYKRMGIDFPGATILYGPPGCGKTYAIDKLSEYLGWPRFDIDANSVASPFIHDTSKKIAETFKKAIQSAPSILVIDEMEAFLSDRSSAGLSGTHHVEEVAEFLREIPEAISKGVLIFAMTNLIDKIDPAILRRGRFDHLVEVRMANTEEINSLLLKKFAELPVDEKVDSNRIAKKLDGHPLSDVSFVLREAGRAAVKKNREKIDDECINEALALLPKNKDDKPKIGFQ